MSWFGCKKERVKTSSPPAPETPVDEALLIVAQPEVTAAQGEAERVDKKFEDRVFEHMRDAGDEVYRNVPITK